jgi:RHS repeat-associated protein
MFGCSGVLKNSVRSCARLLRAVSITALIAVLVGTCFPAHDAYSGTPHSTPKSCGYQGGAACPNPAPPIPNWVYSLWASGMQGVGDPAELVSQYWSPATIATWCTYTPTTDTEYSPGRAYQDGVLIRDEFDQLYSITGYQSSTPPCSGGPWIEGYYYYQVRTLSCLTPTSLDFQSSPLTGPYCAAPPSPTPNPFKQMAPSCQAGCSTGSTSSHPGAANVGSGQPAFGNPINSSNGNKFEVATDYVGQANNPLRFDRTYNGLAGYQLYLNPSQPMGGHYIGAGWSATYFQYLVQVTVTDSTTTYNTVYAYRPDGRVLAFNLYGGVYSPDGDVSASLLQTSSGWQYQTADDTLETYNASGQLLSISRRGQAHVTVNYGATSGPGDPPTSVIDAFGHTLQFGYLIDSNSVQRLASITDPAGKSVTFTYDSYGNLASVTNSDGTTQSYTYGAGYAGYHLLTVLTDESSVQYATWTYNSSNGQALSSQLAGGVSSYTFSYSLSGGSGSVSVTDPLGKSRTYNQSLIWGAYRMTSSNGVCPGCGEDASRVYDANGNITSRTDFNGNQTTYAYDVTQNVETSRTEAYGTSSARTITTSWDPSWRQPDSVTEPNRTTAFTYDSMGNVLTKKITDTTVTPNVARTWTYTYDTYGRMLTAKGPRTDVNSTTTYTYYTCTTGSQCGQLDTVTDPVGNVTTYNTYNAHGQPLTITDPNGTVTTLTYDLRERLTSRQVGTETTTFSYYPTGLLKQVTLPDSSYVLYTYDNAHRLTEISDGAGNSIQYTLDAMGNRTATKTYDPSSVLHGTHTRVYNTLNELYQDVNAANTSAVTTTYGYDSNGNQTTIAAPLSRSTTNAYDPLNRVSQITDPNSGNTYFGYDAEDDLISVKDPRSLTTTYGYNGFGDVKSLASPDTGTSGNTYDSGGNLSVATDARGSTSNYSYDAANRVTQIVYKNSGGVTDQTIVFGYDAGTNGKGRLTSASDANHSMSWSYDTHGRVTGKGLVVGSFNKSVGYGYTNADLTALVTPSGQSVTYAYNSNHQVTSITVNGTTVLSAVTYEPFGGVNGWTWGNGTSTVSRTFNGDGLISQIVTASVTLGYAFDNANRITGISDSSNSALTWTYGYDPLDRLTSATTSAITDGWTYDANGNRLTQTGTTAITFSVSSTNNQLTATSGGLVRTYGYDAAGNTQSNGAYSFAYNNRGRMASTNGASTLYLYNALGQMIEKSGTLGTTILMQDEAGHLIGEYSSTGGLVEETVWLGDIPVATLQPNGSGGVNIFYVHTDHLNTPRKVSRPSDNQLEWRWDTDPFGTTAANQNPAGLGSFVYNLRYPGQYYMAETGLNQNVRRDFDPQVGRYVESDPIGLGAGVNTYAYGEGNPVAVSDKFGLDTAECTRRLNWVPFRAGPFFHQYVCVGNAQTGYSCLGLGPTGNMFNSPGKLEKDAYSPSACQTVLPDNKCVEDCIKKTFGQPPPNYSVDVSHGQNCQTYADGTVEACMAQCKAKSK